MTDRKEEDKKVSDTRGPGSGIKTKDSKRPDDKDREKVDVSELSAEERAARTTAEVRETASSEGAQGANQYLEDVTGGKQHGDNTSSSGGANNPGQHGRDGGTINGEDNNPVPDDPTPEAPPPEGDEEGSAGDEAGTQTDLGIKKDPEIKKL